MLAGIAHRQLNKVDEARLHLFVAQSLAVRGTRVRAFDDAEALASTVRAALDEIDALMPISNDDAQNDEVRQGCALLAKAVDVFGDGRKKLTRADRRRVHTLHRRATRHVAAALSRP